LFRTKKQFDAYVAALVRAGAMEDSSYVWWAIRPSLKHPTLELRAPDCCTLLDDSLAIAALYRTLARYLYRNPQRNKELDAVGRAKLPWPYSEWATAPAPQDRGPGRRTPPAHAAETTSVAAPRPARPRHRPSAPSRAVRSSPQTTDRTKGVRPWQHPGRVDGR